MKSIINSKKGNFFTENILFTMFLLIVACSVVYFYGKDLINAAPTVTTLGYDKIQDILEQPTRFTNKQLEIKGDVQLTSGKYFAGDANGYKLELQDCTKNRVLDVGSTMTFKGYILDTVNVALICGIYNSTEYYQHISDIQSKQALAEQALISQQKAQQKLLQAQQAKAALEQQRLAIEADLKLRIAKIQKGMSQAEVEGILGFEADNCKSQNTVPYSQTECVYSQITDDKFKTSFTLFYIGDGSVYIPGYSVVII